MRLTLGSIGFGLFLTGCPAEDPAPESGEDSTSASADTTGSDVGMSEGPEADSSTGAPEETGTEGSDTGATDTGLPAGPCDIFGGDCPEGTKCMPYADDRGTTWNSTFCSPLDDDPVGLDEACTVVDSLTSGVDNCGPSLMCWNVDEKTLAGTCIGLCTGSAEEPECADECASCQLSAQGPLALCLASCDPVAQQCPDGEACYPVNTDFACAPIATDGEGAVGDACVGINSCAAGNFCASAAASPDCMDEACCVSFCDTEAADPCPGAPQDVVCEPWFEAPAPSNACVDLGVVGACVVPEK